MALGKMGGGGKACCLPMGALLAHKRVMTDCLVSLQRRGQAYQVNNNNATYITPQICGEKVTDRQLKYKNDYFDLLLAKKHG